MTRQADQINQKRLIQIHRGQLSKVKQVGYRRDFLAPTFHIHWLHTRAPLLHGLSRSLDPFDRAFSWYDLGVAAYEFGHEAL